ncbi:nitrite/sulfite reductase [Oscillibacter sp.]|uniref:nitrite/sulfite reductase n=1 Tax=Oscillibacter sp. TaxID=1945593 RepID=UPI002616327B|nr:nitrite/sulfite reductase [Oscillibacter sp.]MDD3346738.1 nitrite/sulfite reductase [Oscillibacter sp.]
MKTIDPQSWKQDLPAFREKTAAFYAGTLDKAAYKGFSGLYGSYAQKGGSASMLRLRMTAGRVTPEKLAFTAKAIRTYGVPRAHFTTCQSIQLHDLEQNSLCAIMEEALDCGIVTMGGGGDFPRNVMCSPLSGVEVGEYFDVMPWAEAAGEYLMSFIKAEKMPRKLKVGFSNSPENVTHATYRDLGFAARPDGMFDVYSAGGLGNNPRFGVLVAEGVAPEKILYYIKAMWLTFRAYGNYENRGKARTRYMQEALGGAAAYAKAYGVKLAEVFASGEELDLTAAPRPVEKTGDGIVVGGPRVIPQKQAGLYTVAWHPIGGQPNLETLCAVSDALGKMPDAEMRLAPDETAYLINLNGEEAEKMLALTADGAKSLFETSVCCIGGATCQVGTRDSQALLAACVAAVRAAELPDGALPQIHISGCPSSCGTHQTGALGLRGGVKLVDGKPQPAFVLYESGDGRQGRETMGRELGPMLETEIPGFLAQLGKTVAQSGERFDAWVLKNPDGVEALAAKYLN